MDITKRMPPASSSALKDADLLTLSSWLDAGAKATGRLCRITEAQAPAAEGGPGMQVMPVEYNDPDLKCYTFLAHAPGDKAQPFSVGTDPDMYKGFTFMPPWSGVMYAKSFRPVIDNKTVIHHWLFFKNMSAGNDGAISDQLGTHPDGQLVHGWAPGGEALYLDPDVGEAVPSDVSYMLETHYNNTTGAAAPDKSGIEICVTPKVPDKVASVSWLGTDNISGTQASGTCEPSGMQPIHLVDFVPHMHLAGRHMKVVINRADGKSEVLHDDDFDFQYQITYRSSAVIMPGDTVTTTCSYSEPKMFGRGSNQEMCYLFTMYYPTLALTNGSPIWSALHGPDTCLQ
jgi:hypothetical protein